MAVGKGNSSEKASAGRVSIPVIGVVTPAFADDDELATDGVGSEERAFVIGAWRTRVPGGSSSRMVAAML